MITSIRLLAALLPLAANAGATGVCGDPATPIHQVQGEGAASPLLGREVTVEGVMTLDARHPGGFKGFYLQQPDALTDGNPRTSEALFVYTDHSRGHPGDQVRVTGEVKEYHGLTELVAVQAMSVCGKRPMPAATDVSLPWSRSPESLENMRVRLTDPLVIVDTYNLGRYGELTLAPGDPVMPTEYMAPGPEALNRYQASRQQQITLDDGEGERDPRPVRWLQQVDSLRAGDTVSRLNGVLDFRFEQWRLQPEKAPVFTTTNPRPAPPPSRPDNHLRVVSMNLHNYFNGDGRGDGFPTSRGAQTPGALARQTRRLTSAIQAASPDILAVTELENDGYGNNSAIADLARRLGPAWRFVATPGADGNDEIRTALLYRSDRVRATGPGHRLSVGPFAGKGRPPLLQTFTPVGGNTGIQIVAAHLKSKSCRNAKGNNQARGDGQGCFATRRVAEAEAIITALADSKDSGKVAGTVLAGDFNSYAMEAPMQLLAEAGFTSLVHKYHPCGPDNCPHYSYRFRGHRGTLDYILASGSLVSRVGRALTWNINADEPRVLDYRRGKADISGPWRASDHNPVIVDLDLSQSR